MRYVFNEFILDTDRFELIQNAEALSVEPQVIELLILLIENKDRLVSRDEMIEKIWKGRVVSDAALSSRIKLARQVLGDDGRKQMAIRTIHKKGFSFVGDVVSEDNLQGPRTSSVHDDAVQSVHTKALPGYDRAERPSVAVLPFTNISGDPEQDYFSDGITGDIIAELSRFSTLYVIARHSSFSFKGQNIGIKEVGEKLAVQYVVEGSVHKAENRIRIGAQLIEAETGNLIWAERYDRKFDDIFAVQDEVTRSIVAVLPTRVQEDVVARASRKPTDIVKAYELMLQGKACRDGLGAEDIASARKFLEKAIELDPRYARAHMYLADTYVVDLWLGLATAEASGKSLQLARKAAKLDSNDVFIQDQLGFAYLCEGLWNEAEFQFDKTVVKIVNEAESLAWCGYAYLMLGQHEKALVTVLEATRLDPSHPITYDWILGQTYFFNQQYEDVVRLLNGEALLNSLSYAFLVSAYGHLDRADEARIALASFIIERRREFKIRNMHVEGDTTSALAGGFRDMWRHEADWIHIVDGLRKAGLPD